MKIGKVANQVGITVEAIRFYEKQGLVAPPGRNESGYRDYPEEIVQHVSFIKRAKELGFSLKEIKELMSLRYTPEGRVVKLKDRLKSKLQTLTKR